MKTRSQKKNNRWVLLRHNNAPDDIKGLHFDFLLEDKYFCRTWRLINIPTLDGPYVDCEYIAPHNLYWLDIKEKVVSGNRGFATRVREGIFLESLPSVESMFIKLSISWESVQSTLLIDENGCRIFSKRY